MKRMKHHSEVKRTKAQSIGEQKQKTFPMHGQNMLATYTAPKTRAHDRSSNLGKYLHKKKR